MLFSISNVQWYFEALKLLLIIKLISIHFFTIMSELQEDNQQCITHIEPLSIIIEPIEDFFTCNDLIQPIDQNSFYIADKDY